jgi:hypothetical protein
MADEFDPNKITDLSQVREQRGLEKTHSDLRGSILEEARKRSELSAAHSWNYEIGDRVVTGDKVARSANPTPWKIIGKYISKKGLLEGSRPREGKFIEGPDVPYYRVSRIEDGGTPEEGEVITDLPEWAIQNKFGTPGLVSDKLPPSEPRSTALVPLAIPPEEDPTKKRAKTKTGIGGLMKKGFWPLRIIGALQQGWDTLSDEHKTEITGFMNKPMHELVGLPPAPDLGIESYLRDLLGMASEEEITESRMQAHGGFTEDEISIATSTARSAGAIGPRALVPRTVQEVASPDDTILDFGAGPKEAHAQNLREDGFNVTAWDFGKNPEALYRQYDIVYASNVLNVQSSLDMLERTVGQIADLVRPGGTFIGNLPLSPRKSPDLNPETLETILLQYFENIERVGGKSNAPVYMAKKLQEKVRKAHGGFIDKPLYERTL